MGLQSMWKLAGAGALALSMMASPVPLTAQPGATVLKAAEAQKVLPPAVFYKGQSAPTQLRNSGGVKFADGYYVLATLVDTSGYSSDVASKYQSYFITEVPIKIGGRSLPAGVYGAGFIGGNRFVVTDVGAHDVLSATYATDEVMKRPVPLQVVTDPGGGFRLYEGRKYVRFSR
ncbi:MAG TPA: hypothetical protein VFI20_08090 [Terracidiphilus sp.]|nr:hypothetical protein [Terracidiphilus sp.]